MIIRPAGLRDLDEIVILNNSEEKWVGHEIRDFFEQYLDIPFFYVAEEDRKINAFIMAMDANTDYDSKNFLWFRERVKKFHYVDRVIVESKRRGRGLGKLLYSELFKRSEGLPIVAEVSIDPPNPKSVGFHNQFGFREIGTFSLDGKKTCRMYKRD